MTDKIKQLEKDIAEEQIRNDKLEKALTISKKSLEELSYENSVLVV